MMWVIYTSVKSTKVIWQPILLLSQLNNDSSSFEMIVKRPNILLLTLPKCCLNIISLVRIDAPVCKQGQAVMALPF